jgi:predicted lipopolysaccharide heptosyltransferase III
MPPGLSRQGRHPGHAHRRGHHRRPLTILLVRLRLIGDVVFTTPIIRAVRRRYPDARLLYLVEQAAAPVVAANPHLSTVITVEHRRGWHRVVDDLRLALRLRREAIDVVIDLHGGPRSALLSWMTQAAVRVGYDVPGRSWMYTHAVQRPGGYRPRHAVENQWDLLAPLDSALPVRPDPARDRVEMVVPASARAELDRQLAGRGIAADVPLILIHVSAGNPFRRWPEASFAKVAATLAIARPQAAILITSGPSDAAATERVVEAARRRAETAAARIVEASSLSLWQLRAACDRAELYIGGDSGPLHIAATSVAPIVGIYGPTRPERSAPWRPSEIVSLAAEGAALACRPCDQRHCVTDDYRCLGSIEPEQVLARARAILARTA